MRCFVGLEKSVRIREDLTAKPIPRFAGSMMTPPTNEASQASIASLDSQASQASQYVPDQHKSLPGAENTEEYEETPSHTDAQQL
jgi:hypothetical protein